MSFSIETVHLLDNISKSYLPRPRELSNLFSLVHDSGGFVPQTALTCTRA
jgi:hypothetical protein